jgi:cytochrome c oxidase subunit 2
MRLPNNCSVPSETHPARWNKRSTLWLSISRGNIFLNIFQAKVFNVNSLRMMLIGLTILSAASTRTVAQVAKDAGTGVQGVHEIRVTLRKYEFTPRLLRVRKGEQVKLVMAAADHDHGFKLDDFNINQKIPNGTTVVVQFTANKAGTFQFRCSSVCGLGHRNMKGILVVEE